MQRTNPQLAGQLTPISAQAPCGPDLARDPVFLRLKEQATAGLKLTPGTSDWSQVSRLGNDLLATRSKDLRIACYLAVAWLHLEGKEGAVRGLELIVSLLDAYPDKLHPQAKRERVLGRDRAMSWYADQFQHWMEKTRTSILSTEQTARCKVLCDQLAAVPRHALHEGARVAARLARSLSPPKIPKASPRASLPASTPPPPLDLRQVCAMQRRLAIDLQSENRLDPTSFRLLRQALWTPVLSLDPAQTRAIELPTQAERQTLNEHVLHRRWPGLLERSEELLLRYPLCLDLQRFSILAIESLTPNAPAKRAILSELSALLHQHPALPEGRGKNDVPLASPQTQAWLRKERFIDAPTGTNPVQAEKTPQAWWKNIEDARHGPVQTLLTQIQSALDQAPDRRHYARRALKIAQSPMSVSGLASLLLDLAIQALDLRSEVILDRELEGQCLRARLQLRQIQGVPQGPEGDANAGLVLALGRRDLSAALPYYQCNA